MSAGFVVVLGDTDLFSCSFSAFSTDGLEGSFVSSMGAGVGDLDLSLGSGTGDTLRFGESSFLAGDLLLLLDRLSRSLPYGFGPLLPLEVAEYFPGPDYL